MNTNKDQEDLFRTPGVMLAAAKIWASRGRPVFPIWPVDPDTLQCTCPRGADCTDKHPILTKSLESATTDPVAIEKLWRRATYRMQKVAEEMGRPRTGLEPAIGGGTAGLIVLDIDSRQGYAEWAALQDSNGPAPETLTTTSGRAVDEQGTRGSHIAFRIPTNLDEETRSRLTIWGGGHLDGRANGKGWVVLPPSLHRSGHRYVIANNSPVAEAPMWVVAYALRCIDNAKGRKKNRAPGASPSTLLIQHAPERLTIPESHPLHDLGNGFCWRASTEAEQNLLVEALCLADPGAGATPGSRDSIDRQTWLGIVWSLRAHDAFHQDGFAHELALKWSQQFRSHTDESFYRTVWNRPPDPGHPYVGRRRIFDLAEQREPNWLQNRARRAIAAHFGAAPPTSDGPEAPANAGSHQTPNEHVDSPTPDGPGGRPVISRNDPSKTAELFVAHEAPALLCTNGEFLEWKNGAYVEALDIQARVHKFLRNALSMSKNAETGEATFTSFKPKSADVSEILAALQNMQFHSSLDRPLWLNGASGPAPETLVAFPNALLDVATGQTLNPTADLFTRNALAFEYDPSNKKVDNWLKFLNSVFDEEGREEKIRLLRQWFGYIISGRTDLQKIFMLVGPARSGKGTIAKILEKLVGRESMYSTTFSRIGGTFGQASFVGKSVVLFPDAHMGQWGERDSITEMLKSISGEDIQSIPRKYKEDWVGKLGARFVIMTNMLPEFPDASGAFASRFVTVQIDVSHIGAENTQLFDQDLAPELPGILNWALEGLTDLRNAGGFSITESSRQIQSTMDLSNNPVRAFAEEHLTFSSKKTRNKPLSAKCDIYNAYRVWCSENGVAQMSAIAFGRKLMAVSGNTVLDGAPKIKTHAGKWIAAYVGVVLKTE
jgi:putative DNA primase/helicase